MFKVIACSMIGFAVVLSLILLFGSPPDWIGVGAKENPTQSAVFLIWMSLCSSLLVFKNRKFRSCKVG